MTKVHKYQKALDWRMSYYNKKQEYKLRDHPFIFFGGISFLRFSYYFLVQVQYLFQSLFYFAGYCNVERISMFRQV